MLMMLSPIMGLSCCQRLCSLNLGKSFSTSLIVFRHLNCVIILINRPNHSLEGCLINGGPAAFSHSETMVELIIILSVGLVGDSEKKRIPRIPWDCIKGWKFFITCRFGRLVWFSWACIHFFSFFLIHWFDFLAFFIASGCGGEQLQTHFSINL